MLHLTALPLRSKAAAELFVDEKSSSVVQIGFHHPTLLVHMIKRGFRIGFALQNTGINISESSGSSLQINHIIRGLQRAGHHVSLVALRPKRRVLFTSDPQLMTYGKLSISGTKSFHLIESGIRRIQSSCRIPYFGLFDSYRFFEACCENLSGYTILHERNNLFSIGTALASRRLGLPYVLSLDSDQILEFDFLGMPLRGIQRVVAKWMAQFSYDAANVVTTVSQTYKSYFISQWGISADKIKVLPNGVDTEMFHPNINAGFIRRKHGLGSAPLIIFVGTFWPWHGLEEFIDIFRIVLKKIPRAKLLLVGDGVVKPKIVKSIAEYHIEDAVIFAGEIDYVTVPAYLNASDVAVAPFPPDVPNSSMGSPMKLFEYMASGNAIVASKIGQIEEILQNDDTGILVEPGNVDEFAQAIIDLLKDPEKRKMLGKNARQQAIEQHTWEQYINRLEHVYQSVL